MSWVPYELKLLAPFDEIAKFPFATEPFQTPAHARDLFTSGLSVEKLFNGVSAIWSVTAMPAVGVQLFAATCPVVAIGEASSPSHAAVAPLEKSKRKPFTPYVPAYCFGFHEPEAGSFSPKEDASNACQSTQLTSERYPSNGEDEAMEWAPAVEFIT